MNEADFWRIIEMTNYQSAGDGEKQAELVVEYLSQLSEGEILDFDYIYRQYFERAYSFALWDAASIINGGCSSDGFDYFRPWLIGQGQAIYEAALADPDSLADVVELGEHARLEVLNYAASYAYEIKTGLDMGEMPMRELPKDSLRVQGEWSDNHEISHPKLYSKFTPYWDKWPDV
jgi:hypothetical protein